MDFQTLTLAGLGGAVCMIAARWLLSKVNRDSKKDEAELSLDARVPILVDIAVKPYQEVNEMYKNLLGVERDRGDKEYNERVDLMRSYIKYATEQDDVRRQEIQGLREEYQKAFSDINGKLRECEQREFVQKGASEEINRRLINLENRVSPVAIST